MRSKFMRDEQETMEYEVDPEYSLSFTQDEFTGRHITQTALDELNDKMENERFWECLPSHMWRY